MSGRLLVRLTSYPQHTVTTMINDGIEIVSYRLYSISPLLQNNPDSMGGSGGAGLTTKRIPTPEEEAKSKLYLLPDGQIYLKTQAVRSALIGACAGFKPKGAKVGVGTLVKGGVFCVAVEAGLVHPKTRKPIKDYKVNTMRAVVMRAGVKRSRPEIPEWSVDVDFEVDTQFITNFNWITELLNRAGRMKGVGDYRPEKSGPYGRFRAVQIGADGREIMPVMPGDPSPGVAATAAPTPAKPKGRKKAA